MTDPWGQSLDFSYDTEGRITAMVTPTGTYSYTYSGATPATTNLTQVIYPGQLTRRYHYNEPEHTNEVDLPNFLTGITDENNARFATWTYDGLGRATSSVHANGVNHATITYDSYGEQSTVTDALGTARTFNFSVQHGVAKVSTIDQPCAVSCSNHDALTSFDANGFIDTKTDFNGTITDYDHNARGLEESRTEAVGTAEERTINTQWHPDFRLPVQIDEPGKRTTFTYTPEGQLQSRTEQDTSTQESRTWTYSYYTSGVLDGLLQSMDGPRTDVSDVTTYTYYTSDDPGGQYRTGDLWQTTNALGQITEVLKYDAHGRALRIEDPNGVITELTYHPRGWLISRTEAAATAAAATTTFSYDNVGQLTRITPPNGAWLEYTYDAAHRLTAISDRLGNTIEYTLDAAGNRTDEDTRDPQGTLTRSLSRVYDSLGRLQDQLGNNGQHTRFGYDNDGNLTSRTEAFGTTGLARTTTYEYDALDRLIRSIDPYNGAAKPTDYTYNSLDQLTQVTDPEGLATSYGYNALGDQHTLTSPDTGITTAQFDAAGNRIQQTDARGVVMNTDYDALGRPTVIDYPDNNLDVSYSYDDTANGNYGIGRVTAMTDASGITEYTYDRRGRLIQESRTLLGIQYVTEYAYDAAGNLTQIVYPSGRTVGYTLDAMGRVSAVSTTANGVTETLADAIDYDPFGPMTEFIYGNGLSRSVSFDLDGRTERVQSGTAQHLSYSYNSLDQLESLTDLIDASRDQSLSYDPLDRLTSASGNYGNHNFAYDGVGNRQSQTGPSGTDSYSYDSQSHRLLSITGPNASSRGYDNAGNTTQLDALDFSYGDNNRLTQIQQSSIPLASYTHNGQGQRVSKTAGG